VSFENLRTFLDQPVLTLPVDDEHTYVVKPCTGDTWLRLQRFALGEEKIPDMDLYRLTLGDTVLDAMLPELTGPELRHVGMTSYLWQLGRTEVAEEYWRSGGKAESAETPTPTRTPRTTRSAAASTTRRRASGKTTSTRRKSSPSAKG
jgi:hypothetical protein